MGVSMERQCILVMAGLVPAIHVFRREPVKTWMPGIKPADD